MEILDPLLAVQHQANIHGWNVPESNRDNLLYCAIDNIGAELVVIGRFVLYSVDQCRHVQYSNDINLKHISDLEDHSLSIEDTDHYYNLFIGKDENPFYRST
jgi:hypothetical protein